MSKAKDKLFEFDGEVTLRFTMKGSGATLEDAKERARERFQTFAELLGAGGIDLGDYIVDLPTEVGIDFDPSDDIEDDDDEGDPGEYDESELEED